MRSTAPSDYFDFEIDVRFFCQLLVRDGDWFDYTCCCTGDLLYNRIWEKVAFIFDAFHSYALIYDKNLLFDQMGKIYKTHDRCRIGLCANFPFDERGARYPRV